MVAEARHAGRRADDVAREWLGDVLGEEPARAAVRRLIMAGALRVDGRPLRAPGRVLGAGASLEMTVRPELVSRTPAVPAASLRILYEDSALIAVDKPAGLPTVATADGRRAHLVGLVERRLEDREGPRSRPLGVHQRLDRDTTGVVLLVKDPAANAGLSRQFSGRAVAKTYLALVQPPDRARADAFTIEEPIDAPARTHFRILERWPAGLLVEARPQTGRKHQIRIHLAGAGMPILGDARYGRAAEADRLMLHAARLELTHPLTGVPLAIESPLPEDFRAALDRLRASGRGTPPR